MSEKKPEMTRGQQAFWIVVAIFAAFGGMKFYEYAQGPNTCFTDECYRKRSDAAIRRMNGFH